VVDASLGVLTGCAGKLRWQTAEMFGEAAMAEPWDGVGKAAMAGTHNTRGGFWVGEMLTPVVKPQWVRYKLEETIEKFCSDLVAIHQRRCIFGKMEIFWSPTGDEITTHGMCTTSTKCKTVITAVLTVMSDMDPHMISGT
jgi:hypothetical protein